MITALTIILMDTITVIRTDTITADTTICIPTFMVCPTRTRPKKFRLFP